MVTEALELIKKVAQLEKTAVPEKPKVIQKIKANEQKPTTVTFKTPFIPLVSA
jgi:hypothetical protein